MVWLASPKRESLNLFVSQPAVVVVIDSKLAGEHAFHDRPGDRQVGNVVRSLLSRQPPAHLERVARRLGPQQHRAARHVASEQHALRAAQHFDALDIETVEQDAGVDAHVDAVHEHADGRINGGNGAVDSKAANGEIGGGGRGPDVLELHVRHGVAQGRQVLEIQRFELIGAVRGDRERNILNIFRMALLRGRYGDHFQLVRRHRPPEPCWRQWKAATWLRTRLKTQIG